MWFIQMAVLLWIIPLRHGERCIISLVILREHSTLSEKEILELSEKFKEGHTDAMLVNLDGKNYYLVYEKSEIFRTGYFWDLSRLISSMPA